MSEAAQLSNRRGVGPFYDIYDNPTPPRTMKTPASNRRQLAQKEIYAERTIQGTVASTPTR
jgi:hypothetical protein